MPDAPSGDDAGNLMAPGHRGPEPSAPQGSGPHRPPDPYGPPSGYGPPGGYGPLGSSGQYTLYGAPGPSAGPYGTPYGQGPYPPQPYGWPYRPPSPPPPPRRTPEERRRRVRRGLVVGAVLVLIAGIGFGIGSWLAPTSPTAVARALLTKSIAAATSAGTFHYVELSTSGGGPNDITGNAGPNDGSQVITQHGASGIDAFDLRLVKDVVYFRGNKAAVIDQLGVPTTKAPSDVNRWVSIHKGESPYATFADGITTRSNLAQLSTTFVARASAPTPGSTPPATRIMGGLYDGKDHPPIGTAEVMITTSSSLPQSLSAQAVAGNGAHLSLSWQFSHWHEQVKVTAPSRAVPYSSLGATPPSKSR